MFASSQVRQLNGAQLALRSGRSGKRYLSSVSLLENGVLDAMMAASGTTQLGRTYRLDSGDGDITPSVSCVGLNVMGVNISSAAQMEGSKAWKQYKKDVLEGDTCSYPGKVSNTVSVSEGGVITIEVPFGAERVIQLVGYAGMECGQSLSGESMLDEDAVPGAYELGRSVTDLMQASPTVDIEFDLDVLDQVETNEEAATVNEFVPDIRCQVKGEPETQFEQIKEVVAARNPTPSPTPSASPEPEPVLCGAGQYRVDGECVDVGEGYWSGAGDDDRYECTNAPAHAAYDSMTSSSARCSWACGTGYAVNAGGTACDPLCEAGLYLSGGECIAAGLGYYADGTDNLRHACTNKDSNSAYTGTNETSSDCAWSCNFGYSLEGGTCIASAASQTLDCGTGKAMVGILGRNGSIMDQLGIICQNINAGKPTGSTTKTATVGGGGGTAFADFLCTGDQVVRRVSGNNGTYGAMNSTLSITVGCIDLTTSATSSSSQYGSGSGSGAASPYDYSCPAGQHAYGLVAETGDYMGATMNLLCRE